MTDFVPVFIDTNCFKELRAPEAQEAFAGKAADLGAAVVPSVINVFEVLRHPANSYRDALLQVIKNVAADRPLAPWPYQLLRQVGQAVLAGQGGVPMAHLAVDRFLEPGVADGARAEVLRNGQEMEAIFQDTFPPEARAKIQAFLKERNVRDEWKDARSFLDQVWMRPEQIDDYYEGVWARLGLHPPAPIDKLRLNATWTLFFEAYGVAVFERAFMSEQPKQFGIFDLLQLIYPTGFAKSYFLTSDKALKRAATTVFQPVSGARVLTLSDWASVQSGAT